MYPLCAVVRLLLTLRNALHAYGLGGRGGIREVVTRDGCNRSSTRGARRRRGGAGKEKRSRLALIMSMAFRSSCLRMTRTTRDSCRISRDTFSGRSSESTTP